MERKRGERVIGGRERERGECQCVLKRKRATKSWEEGDGEC